MKILHVCTHDTAGGAAMAAYRLHQGLRQLGHDSTMLVQERRGFDPSVVAFKPPMDPASRVSRRLRYEYISKEFSRYSATLPSRRDVFSTERSRYSTQLLSRLPPCDIINLHWIAGFVDYKTFFARVSPSVPILWTLHDMNAFTGGCHYDLECGGYAAHCGACPQLGSIRRRDLSYQVWERKRTIFDRLKPDKLHLVALNRWMAEAVKKSPLLCKFPLTIIPNGLDIETFTPKDRSMAREAFGIPPKANVLLSLADGPEQYRKGYLQLSHALAGLDSNLDLFILFMGSDKTHINLSIPSLHVGYIDNKYVLSLVYSAADLVIAPSLQDNLPNGVLEAMACGIPVVGFDVGGIPDMVRPGITGLLAPSGDIGALRDAIAKLIRNPAKLHAMGSVCRAVAVKEYALKVQAQNYEQLYKSLI